MIVMKPLKVGIVGYGAIGKVHALGYRAIPFLYGLPAETVQIAAVATSRAETAHEAAREIGAPFHTADYRELLARADIDMIDICAPNHLHEEIVIAAAQAGKAIYCEKPLALSVESGERMVKAVQDAGVKTQMTFNFRYFPAIQRARQMIADGVLGTLFSFRGRYYRSSYIDPQKPTSWKLRRETSGGGALYDIGSHVLDILYALLGDFASVQAMLETVIRERPVAKGAVEMAEVNVDDIAFLHARLADGTVGLVEISRLGTGFTNEIVVEIFGEKGSLRWSAAEPAWLDFYDVRDPETPLGGTRGVKRIETVGRFAGAQSPDWSMMPDFQRIHAECQYRFLKAIDEGRDGEPTLAQGLHVQRVLEAAQKSAEVGRWMPV
jgi:predicted dehydrogenase